MKLTFNTDRPYSKEGQIIQAEVFNTYIEDNVTYSEAFFYDTARKIGGVMTFDNEFDTFTKGNIIFKYDNYNFDEDNTPQAREFFNLEHYSNLPT